MTGWVLSFILSEGIAESCAHEREAAECPFFPPTLPSIVVPAKKTFISSFFPSPLSSLRVDRARAIVPMNGEKEEAHNVICNFWRIPLIWAEFPPHFDIPASASEDCWEWVEF